MLDLGAELLSNLAPVTPVNQWPGYDWLCGSLALEGGRQIFLKRAVFMFGEGSSMSWSESPAHVLLTKALRTS